MGADEWPGPVSGRHVPGSFRVPDDLRPPEATVPGRGERPGVHCSRTRPPPQDLRLPPSRRPPAPTEHDSDDSQADSKRWPRLSREQEELRDALARVDPRLGPTYVGGLRVLEDDSNPDRLAQAAHSMRELMEKIEERFAGPIRGGVGGKRPMSLKARLRQIEEPFASGRARSSCHSEESGWSGEIDVHLRKVLDKLDEFFEWFDRLHPRRSELFERMLAGLDPSGMALPASLVRRNRKTWKKLRGFFVGVSHHTKDTDHETLRDRIRDLEDFLADRLLPKTSEDLDAIDALVEEARDA